MVGQKPSGLPRFSISRVLRNYFYETEHAVIDEMITDSADHQVGTRFRKTHDFHPITRVFRKVRVRPPVDPVIRIVDNSACRASRSEEQCSIDVFRLGPSS
jgi:hypothetical protein